MMASQISSQVVAKEVPNPLFTTGCWSESVLHHCECAEGTCGNLFVGFRLLRRLPQADSSQRLFHFALTLALSHRRGDKSSPLVGEDLGEGKMQRRVAT
jgi:hypothetical protein